MPNMGKSSKSESPAASTATATTTATEQANIHVYPDWAAIQAYYGPRVAISPYYDGSPVPSGHAPHTYVWAPPQHMMPPYRTPYGAVYPHGGMYGHPAVALGPRQHAAGVPSSPVAAAAPMRVETPTKSISNTDRGLSKKLKGFDGLAMSIGLVDGTSENTVGDEKRLCQSSEIETSTDHSNGNTSEGSKRSREGSPAQGGNVKHERRAVSIASVEANESSTKVSVPTIASAGSDGKSVGVSVTPGMNTTLELSNPSSENAAKAIVNCVPQSGVVLPPGVCSQNERELKRERRKQSNRESARRSRLRKQAETEELSRKVELLTDENVALKSEMDRLEEKSQKLRLENAALMERLKNGPPGGKQKIILSSGDETHTEVTTENLLSRVENAAPVNRGVTEEVQLYQRKPNSGPKLHQLLDASPKTDAVAAG